MPDDLDDRLQAALKKSAELTRAEDERRAADQKAKDEKEAQRARLEDHWERISLREIREAISKVNELLEAQQYRFEDMEEPSDAAIGRRGIYLYRNNPAIGNFSLNITGTGTVQLLGMPWGQDRNPGKDHLLGTNEVFFRRLLTEFFEWIVDNKRPDDARSIVRDVIRR